MTIWDILRTYANDFLQGLEVTFHLNLIVWSVGILAGTILGVMAGRWGRVVGVPVRVMALVLIGTPFIVLLFWMHYPAQMLFGVVVRPFITASVTLSLLNTLLVADLVRRELQDFPTQHVQAAKTCGLTRRRTVLSVQLPLMLRDLIPSILLVQIVMLHASLFASLISVDEIFRVAQRVNSRIYRPVEIYTLLAMFFLIVTLPLYGLAAWMRKRFTRDISER